MPDLGNNFENSSYQAVDSVKGTARKGVSLGRKAVARTTSKAANTLRRGMVKGGKAAAKGVANLGKLMIKIMVKIISSLISMVGVPMLVIFALLLVCVIGWNFLAEERGANESNDLYPGTENPVITDTETGVTAAIAMTEPQAVIDAYYKYMSTTSFTITYNDTLDIVDRWAMDAFGLDIGKDYFIKTGTYSSKFDFRNARVSGAKEVRELGEYLLFIHHQAIMMAGPLSTPCVYGVSTTNEWVVREFIPDKENNPCIYKGLPLHTEYRVFIDCDTKEVIGCSPYWEPETMKKRFGTGTDANSPHQMHDYIIYKAHEEVLMGRYRKNLDAVLAGVRDILPDLGLKGQWSLDIMQNGDDFWIIDMALAENSAFYDRVPPELRHPTPEDWLPCLS